jgi:hypothetical protein
VHVGTKFTLPLLITESAFQESPPSRRHRRTLVVGSPSEKLGIFEGVSISQGLAVVIRLRQRRGVGRLFLLVLLSVRRNCSKPRFEDTPPDFARAGRTLFLFIALRFFSPSDFKGFNWKCRNGQISCRFRRICRYLRWKIARFQGLDKFNGVTPSGWLTSGQVAVKIYRRMHSDPQELDRTSRVCPAFSQPSRHISSVLGAI